MKRVLLAVLLCTAVGFTARAQGSESDSLLAEGMEFYHAGKYAEAIDRFLSCAQMEKEASGEDSYRYADTQYALGQVYFEIGEYQKATTAKLTAFRARMKPGGLYHPDLALSLSDLAMLNSFLGYYDKAVDSETDALKTYEKLYGTEDSLYVSSLADLANYNFLAGHFEEAFRLQDEVFETLGRTSGRKSVEYAAALDRMAGFRAYFGEYEEAVRMEMEALDIYEKTKGALSREYAGSLGNLSDYYLDCGYYEGSLQAQLRSGEIYKTIFGEDNIYYAMSLVSTAGCKIMVGEFAVAANLIMTAMDILKKAVGENNPHYATALSYLALDCYGWGNYANAIFFEQAALKTYRNTIQWYHPHCISSLNRIADCYIALGNYGEAIVVGTEALENAEHVFGREHSDYAAQVSAMARLYSSAGDNEKALDLEKQALHIFGKAVGEKHALYANSLDRIADYYSFCGDDATAIKAETKALEIYEYFYGEGTDQYASALSSLARFNANTGDYDTAVGLQTKAAELFEKTIGKPSPDYTTSLQSLSLYLSATGDYDNAVRFSEEAFDIIKENYGVNSSGYVRAAGQLAHLNFRNKDYNKTTEYAVAATQSLYSMVRDTFTKLTSNERSLFWDKYKDWFETDLPYYAFIIRNNAMISIEYDVALMSKGLLLNSELEMEKLLYDSEKPDVMEKYRILQQNRAALGRLYESPAGARRMDADSLERVVKREEEELMHISKKYGDYTKNLTISWQEVQEKLGEKDVAVEFIDFDAGTEHIYTALTLCKGDKTPQPFYLFEKKELLSVDESSYYTSPAIAELVWKPLAEVLRGKENVYFSPSGELYNIAVENVPSWEGGMVSDRWNLYRLSSTRQLALSQEKAGLERADIYGGLAYSTDTETLVNDFVRHGGKRSAEFGTVSADSLGLRGGVGELPKAKEEAEKIYGIVGKTSIAGNIYTDTLGTETSLKFLSGRRTNILHIATHGFFWTESEALERKNLGFLGLSDESSGPKYAEDKMLTRSGLLFAGANITLKGGTLPEGVEDGVLTAKEISVLDLRGLDLVVLSACQTGLGEITGDGVFGLQRGFKKAGANSLMMSLWKVDDDATHIFMTEFYRIMLEEHKSKRAAFLAARDFLRTTDGGKFDKPEFWAAFILLDALD